MTARKNDTSQTPRWEKRLTNMQVAFTREYVKTGDKLKAALDAGYTNHNLKRRVRELMANPKIQDRIELLRDRADIASIADHEECCKLLTEIIRTKVGDFIDDQGNVALDKFKQMKQSSAIQEIDIQEGNKSKSRYPRTRIKMYSVLAAIEKLSTLRGWGEKFNKRPPPGLNNLQINIVGGNQQAQAQQPEPIDVKGNANGGTQRDNDTEQPSGARQLGDGGS